MVGKSQEKNSSSWHVKIIRKSRFSFLEHCPTHLLMYCLRLLHATMAALNSCDGAHCLQNLKYVLPGHMQKNLTNPWASSFPAFFNTAGTYLNHTHGCDSGIRSLITCYLPFAHCAQSSNPRSPPAPHLCTSYSAYMQSCSYSFSTSTLFVLLFQILYQIQFYQRRLRKSPDQISSLSSVLLWTSIFSFFLW